MSSKTLSIAPYYGGKGRIAHFLTDRFDYKNTEIYVSAFGGMCRDLLNKPRHEVETYNDYNIGLCTLMRVLSIPDMAQEMITRLYDETEFSRDCFDKFKAIYDRADMNIVEWEKRGLVNLICSCLQQPQKGRDNRKAIAEEVFDKLLYESGPNSNGALNNLLPVGQYKRRIAPAVVSDAYEQFMKCVHTDKRVQDAIDTHLNNIALIADTEEKFKELPSGGSIEDFNSIDLAMATFIVFTMSYYGQGTNFNGQRFKSQEEYEQRVLRLHECAERLESIQVANTDTMRFFTNSSISATGSQTIRAWLDNEDVMMYCDPSYISPDDEQELLKGINLASGNPLSDEIEKKYRNTQKGKLETSCQKTLALFIRVRLGIGNRNYFCKTFKMRLVSSWCQITTWCFTTSTSTRKPAGNAGR